MKSFLVFFTILTSVYGDQNPCCEEGKIPCDNGVCIERSNWCDYNYHCPDMSDERYCKKRSDDDDDDGMDVGNHCTDKHFVCDDGMCIPVTLRCDSKSDCSDNSDENSCNLIEQKGEVARKAPETRARQRPNNQQSTEEETTSTSSCSKRTPNKKKPLRDRLTKEHSQTRDLDYPQITREKRILYKPRFSISPLHPKYSHFYFAKNYTRRVERKYKTNIRDAEAWLLSQRDYSYGWGKDTPEVLIALSLISNSFQSDVNQNELLKKGLQKRLEELILGAFAYEVYNFRNLTFDFYYGLFFQSPWNNTRMETISTTRIAMYINALLATCQNPRDFLGLDLPGKLLFGQYISGLDQKVSPFRGNPLIGLSQCLTSIPMNPEYLQTKFLNPSTSDITREDQILAVLALACQAQLYPTNTTLRSIVDVAARNLLNQINPADGSFGNVYDTALAAQVLMSVNTSLDWDYRATLDYLAEQQKEDGSFGDLQSTYQSLIALSGRSLLHVRNTLCDSSVEEQSLDDIMNREGQKKSILYTLRADYPETFSTSLRLSVPLDTNFYDIMRIAARQDPRFKFRYKIYYKKMEVHLIGNIFNRPGFRLFWNLYWLPSSTDTLDLNHRFTGDIRRIVPNDGDELLFWYLYNGKNDD